MAAASSSGWVRGATSQGSLQYDYYSQLCPNAEQIALQTLQSNLFLDITAPAALLRLTFHDCQVQVRRQLRLAPHNRSRLESSPSLLTVRTDKI